MCALTDDLNFRTPLPQCPAPSRSPPASCILSAYEKDTHGSEIGSDFDERFLAARGGSPAGGAGKTIKLFNGKNLDGFYTYTEKQGRNHDPNHVFTVQDGTIRVSGEELGYFATEAEYENYRLTAEFKWGEKTHAPREGLARDSGILYHFVGPDKIFPKSIEFQIIEGGTGDIIVVDGASLTVAGVTHNEGRIDRQGKGPWKDIAGYRDPAG